MSDLMGIPVNALFDSTNTTTNRHAAFDPKRLIIDADIMIGRDVMSGREFILYGRQTMQQMARDGECDEGEHGPVTRRCEQRVRRP